VRRQPADDRQSRVDRRQNLGGGSRGLGQSYFFLLELLFLAPLLLELLLFEPDDDELFLEPLDLAGISLSFRRA
jgi:hypothetical protein